ncbi:MAG: amidohydrolase family protein, partial [Xanthomonadales bacterium]|nr:amidohydrolase family protein [Xanthomonadales bacterium]
ESFVELARTRDAFVIPTLAVIEAIDSDNDPLSRIGIAAQENLLSPMQRQTLSARFGGDLPGFRLKTALENVRRLHAGGVRLLAGSDAPNPGTAQGVSLHRELQLLVRAGLEEHEALAAATVGPAETFGLEGRGRIAEGARADLVLVEGNPLEDISRTLAIRTIIKNGHPVPRLPGKADAPPVLVSDLLGDFEGGMPAPRGFAWTSTDDGMVNGASEVAIERSARADKPKDHALRVTATVRSGFPYPWAGGALMSSAGGDISDFRAVQFEVRGTPGVYRLMGFNLAAGGIPPTVNFEVSPDWRTHTISLADLQGLDPAQLLGFAWVAGPEPGESTLYLDNVRLVK